MSVHEQPTGVLQGAGPDRSPHSVEKTANDRMQEVFRAYPGLRIGHPNGQFATDGLTGPLALGAAAGLAPATNPGEAGTGFQKIVEARGATFASHARETHASSKPALQGPSGLDKAAAILAPLTAISGAPMIHQPSPVAEVRNISQMQPLAPDYGISYIARNSQTSQSVLDSTHGASPKDSTSQNAKVLEGDSQQAEAAPQILSNYKVRDYKIVGDMVYGAAVCTEPGSTMNGMNFIVGNRIDKLVTEGWGALVQVAFSANAVAGAASNPNVLAAGGQLSGQARTARTLDGGQTFQLNSLSYSQLLGASMSPDGSKTYFIENKFAPALLVVDVVSGAPVETAIQGPNIKPDSAIGFLGPVKKTPTGEKMWAIIDSRPYLLDLSKTPIEATQPIITPNVISALKVFDDPNTGEENVWFTLDGFPMTLWRYKNNTFVDTIYSSIPSSQYPSMTAMELTPSGNFILMAMQRTYQDGTVQRDIELVPANNTQDMTKRAFMPSIPFTGDIVGITAKSYNSKDYLLTNAGIDPLRIVEITGDIWNRPVNKIPLSVAAPAPAIPRLFLPLTGRK